MNKSEMTLALTAMFLATLWVFWAKSCEQDDTKRMYDLEMKKVEVYGKPTPTPAK